MKNKNKHKMTNEWEKTNKCDAEVRLRKSENAGKKEKTEAVERWGRKGVCMC